MHIALLHMEPYSWFSTVAPDPYRRDWTISTWYLVQHKKYAENTYAVCSGMGCRPATAKKQQHVQNRQWCDECARIYYLIPAKRHSQWWSKPHVCFRQTQLLSSSPCVFFRSHHSITGSAPGAHTAFPMRLVQVLLNPVLNSCRCLQSLQSGFGYSIWYHTVRKCILYSTYVLHSAASYINRRRLKESNIFRTYNGTSLARQPIISNTLGSRKYNCS